MRGVRADDQSDRSCCLDWQEETVSKPLKAEAYGRGGFTVVRWCVGGGKKTGRCEYPQICERPRLSGMPPSPDAVLSLIRGSHLTCQIRSSRNRWSIGRRDRTRM